MAILSDRDDAEWARHGQLVSAVVAPRLSARVLANRTLRDAAAPSSLGPSLRRAGAAATTLSTGSDCVIRTDVRAFYPSVSPSVAFDSVASLGKQTAHRIAEMLEGWGSEGYAGLPIGPPASAVIANAILGRADEALNDLPFLRWVDDYLIGVRERDVSSVLDRLDSALELLDLQRSGPKTRILPGRVTLSWPGTYGRGSPSE